MSINREGKAFIAVSALIIAILLGINAMVTRDADRNWVFWAVALLIVAIGFWLWIRQEEKEEQDQRLALMKAEESAREAEARQAEEAAKAEDAALATAKTQEMSVVAASPADKPAQKISSKRGKKDDGDDLTVIEGIGPKISKTLIAAGIDTYAKLAQATEDQLIEIITAAGMIKPGSVSTWAEQAALAAKGDWEALQALQSQLSGGRRTS